jgi:GntR family transcriptional regulator of arabinose operon
MPRTATKPADNTIPRYRLLADELRQQIQSRQLLPGDRLPTFAEMRIQYNVTSTTIERVYGILESEGLIKRQQGSGTFVTEQKRPTTGNIGLLFQVESLTNPYEMDLLAGMRYEAMQHGMEILLLNAQDENADYEKFDAIAMYCDIAEATSLNLPPNMPAVLLFETCPEFTCIVPDDFEGVRLATQHLIAQGHQKIAYLQHSYDDSIGWQRMAGYEAAHREAGIAAENKHIRQFEKPLEQDYREAAEIVMRDWLESDWSELGCTAVLAHNDEVAIGIMGAFAEYGLNVPQDVSVVGFDGTMICDLCTPKLTSIKVPLREIGSRAVKVLMEQLQGGVKTPEKITLPVQLIPGASVQPIEEPRT